MKSVTGVKSKFDSPKTPGGISRSLLTPCRRLGLSRNWKKSGSSPFQSPLSSSSEVKQEDAGSRKRKESIEITQTPEENLEISSEAQTPTRIEAPRRKKSKTLLSAINKSLENTESVEVKEIVITQDIKVCNDSLKQELENHTEYEIVKVDKNKEGNSEIVSPLRLKTKSRSKNKITSSSNQRSTKISAEIKENTNIKNSSNVIVEHNTDIKIKEAKIQRKSPNNLTKECMVVIQKKIYKKDLEKAQTKLDEIEKPQLDSDSDDIPLNQINKEEDDFTTKPKIKNKTPKNSKSPRTKTTKIVKAEVHAPSQNSEDDDFVDTKKTILIRKTYNKVVKPQKAKSTGSITQRDIDELKARIETKKKMLLAKSMTEDTKELKDLIKKWQKGCQDALIELMDLMKNKFPDKQNMEYSEILETLKIPPSLVGYDSDNDCFLTPNDEDVILARFKD